jgi:hypothetical protein
MTNGGTKAARIDVERIVRQVLAQMADPSLEGALGGELVLTSRVVSLAEVENRLNGVSRLVAPRGAVFTPAARDELRKHNVAIASAVPAAQPTDPVHLVVGVAETNYEAASLVKALVSEGVNIERLPQVGLIGVVDELCEHVVKGGRFGLMITQSTAVALCLANRQHGVRAALGNSVPAAQEAATTMGANLLVTSPEGRSVFELRQFVRILMQGGQRNCPPALRERLG